MYVDAPGMRDAWTEAGLESRAGGTRVQRSIQKGFKTAFNRAPGMSEQFGVLSYFLMSLAGVCKIS